MCFEDKKVDNFLYFIKSHNYLLRDCCIDQSLPYAIVVSFNRYPMRLLHRSIVTLRDCCIDQSLPYEIVASINRYPTRFLYRSIVTLRDCCIVQSLPYEIVASINRYPKFRQFYK